MDLFCIPQDRSLQSRKEVAKQASMLTNPKVDCKTIWYLDGIIDVKASELQERGYIRPIQPDSPRRSPNRCFSHSSSSASIGRRQGSQGIQYIWSNTCHRRHAGNTRVKRLRDLVHICRGLVCRLVHVHGVLLEHLPISMCKKQYLIKIRTFVMKGTPLPRTRKVHWQVM